MSVTTIRPTDIGASPPNCGDYGGGDDKCVDCPVRAAMKRVVEDYDNDVPGARIEATGSAIAVVAAYQGCVMSRQDAESIVWETRISSCDGPKTEKMWQFRLPLSILGIRVIAFGPRVVRCQNQSIAKRLRNNLLIDD